MSKVWNDMHRDVETACRKSIADLQCDYLDMYFIHWPFPNYHAPGCDVDSRNPDSKPLTDEEMAIMGTLERGNRLVKGHVFLWEGAKDWHDLWDEGGFIVK